MCGGDSAVKYVTLIYIFVYTNKSGIVGPLVIEGCTQEVQGSNGQGHASRLPRPIR